MPALEAHHDAFCAAHTQVLGVSIDSVHSHANWAAKDLGGISFPLLSDFHPKGAVGDLFGAYLGERGLDDRATVLIDASGKVVWSESVGTAGERDIDALLERCQALDAGYTPKLADLPAPTGLPPETELFVKTGCGFSKVALNALANLHLEDSIMVRNITETPPEGERLESIGGKRQVPCLVEKGEALFESAEIVQKLVSQVTNL